MQLVMCACSPVPNGVLEFCLQPMVIYGYGRDTFTLEASGRCRHDPRLLLLREVARTVYSTTAIYSLVSGRDTFSYKQLQVDFSAASTTPLEFQSNGLDFVRF